MNKPLWFGFMFLCHLKVQKKDCYQGDNAIIKPKGASRASQIFSVMAVSPISEAEFPWEDFHCG